MMKDHALQNLLRTRLRRASVAAERYFGPLSGPRQATVYQEMHLGSAVGVSASLAYACAFGAPALLLLPAALAGYCAGAVIGLLIWNSSADLPEDPVLPPARSQERYARARA